MQYKIPVQIENEDPIIFGLSLRQITIILIGFGLSFSLFKSLSKQLGAEIAIIPSAIIFLFGISIAAFRHSEMNFVTFILAFLRLKITAQDRMWVKSVDSYQPIDIGYVSISNEKVEKTIDFKSKIDKISELADKIDKI